MWNASFLFASLIWGSVGVGFLVYGTRQKAWVPTLGGVLMIMASYLASSALVMSVVCLAVAFGVYLLLSRGY
jgi:hypothetical protein